MTHTIDDLILIMIITVIQHSRLFSTGELVVDFFYQVHIFNLEDCVDIDLRVHQSFSDNRRQGLLFDSHWRQGTFKALTKIECSVVKEKHYQISNLLQ